jgi:hypothetical protein
MLVNAHYPSSLVDYVSIRQAGKDDLVGKVSDLY